MSTTIEKTHLMGWGTFEDLQHSIRAALFGEMVKRATPVVFQYQSDLFHDARWINKNVNGPTSFEWMVRGTGTSIGDSARAAMQIGPGPGAGLYRIDVTEERRAWSATFTVLDKS